MNNFMTEQEYLKKLGDLFDKVKSTNPNLSESELNEKYLDAEFDLLIDFKMGLDYPSTSRAKIFAIRASALKKLENAKIGFSRKILSEQDFFNAIQSISAEMCADLLKELTPAEVTNLFGNIGQMLLK